MNNRLVMDQPSLKRLRTEKTFSERILELLTHKWTSSLPQLLAQIRMSDSPEMSTLSVMESKRAAALSVMILSLLMMQRCKLLIWPAMAKTKPRRRLWRRGLCLLHTVTKPWTAWPKITLVRSISFPKDTDPTNLLQMTHSTTKLPSEMRSSLCKTVLRKNTPKTSETLMASWKCIWNSCCQSNCSLLCP